jgi:hypothetical protein
MSRHLTRAVSTALVTGLASLVLAGPADALMAHDPDLGGTLRADNNTGLSTPSKAPAPATDDGGTPWIELGIGALGGLALAGAGTAAAIRLRHRQTVTT